MNNESEGEKPRDMQDELPWPAESTEKAYEETNASMDQLSEKLQEPGPESAALMTAGPKEDIPPPPHDATEVIGKDIAGIELGYYAERDKRMLQSKKDLTDTCAILFKAGVTRVEIYYDGYGDSGSIERVKLFKGKKFVGLASDEVDSLELPTTTSKKYVFSQEGGGYEDVECSVLSQIEDCAYDFLPMGWEINEGSFGDVVINTEKSKITLKHNTRIESTEYSEARYDLTSEEGLERPSWVSGI